MEVSNKIFKDLLKRLKNCKFDKKLHDFYSKYENDEQEQEVK